MFEISQTVFGSKGQEIWLKTVIGLQVALKLVFRSKSAFKQVLRRFSHISPLKGPVQVQKRL